MAVINAVQDAILHLFGEVPDSSHWYLTGGTALAHFYLQHRQSNDLDFFTADAELILPFSQQLETTMKEQSMVVQRQRAFQSFVELIVDHQGETTMIHLAQETPFRLEAVQFFPNYPQLPVDSLVDIAANKCLALFRRATLRDFIDVYCLVHEGHFPAETLLANAKQKDPGFDLYWLGVAFERIKTFTDQAPDMLMLTRPIPFAELRVFFDTWRAQITSSLMATP